MDPNAAFLSFDRATMTRDREAVAEAANALVGWLERGGFLPTCQPFADCWLAKLDHKQLTCYFRDVRHVAEMA